MNHGRDLQYYGDYLGIDKLLELQKPLSLKEGKLIAHDEMLFIIVHQAYELWFKQIRHELEACGEVLSKPAADDDGPDLNVVVHRLKRIVEIWKLLNHQVDVLETMTPLDFLEFRQQLAVAACDGSLRLCGCFENFKTMTGEIGSDFEALYHRGRFTREHFRVSPDGA